MPEDHFTPKGVGGRTLMDKGGGRAEVRKKWWGRREGGSRAMAMGIDIMCFLTIVVIT